MMTKKQAQMWANALRSGEYLQTTDRLQDKDGYCCLGVACRLFIEPSKLVCDSNGYLVGDMPNCQDAAPQWLQLINTDLDRKLGMGFSLLNDSAEQYTFDEIADIIELVYVHKAL